MEHETKQPDPESEPHLGIFERLNNYLLLIYAGACLLMYFTLSTLLYAMGAHVLSLFLPGLVAIVFPLFMLSRRLSLRFGDEYRLWGPAVGAAALSLLASAALVIPVETLSAFIERRWPPGAEYINFLIAIKPKGLLSYALAGAGLVVITPVAEELIFRGIIQRVLMRNIPHRPALIFSALLFALCHFDLPSIPAITALGLLYGYLFLATGNLLYPILGHALFNLYSFVRLARLSESDLRSLEPGYPPAWLLALSLALLAVCLLRLRALASRQ